MLLSVLRLTLPVLTYDLKQNEVKKETTHPPSRKKSTSCVRSQ